MPDPVGRRVPPVPFSGRGSRRRTRPSGDPLPTGRRLKPISEKAFQTQVCQLGTRCGWKWWHFHDSRRQVGSKLVGDKDAAGFPDLVMCHPSRGVVFVELKSADGRVAAEQRAALEHLAVAAMAMAANGAATAKTRVHLWRPEDWPVVQELLVFGRGPITYGV